MKYPETPEIDRMKAVQSESHSIGDFIDWLNQNDMPICQWMEWEDSRPGYYPIYLPIEKLLANYFEIDLDKVENERRAILDAIRS